jgi:glycosyltransferase involved in cell wall biosynthesis
MQTSPFDEVVIVDDGSRPTELAALEAEVERAGKSVRFARLDKHLGMAAARNYGARLTECEWVMLVDSDDRLTTEAGALVRSRLHERWHLVYGDHEFVTASGLPIHLRKKAVYDGALSAWGGTWKSPLLHSTFVFHPQVYRRATLERLGWFDQSWGYGDEIELQLRIEEECGHRAIAHVPAILYQYVQNPDSVVHQPKLYELLIKNIGEILLLHMQRRRPGVTTCKRLGRARDHHAAHYAFTSGAEELRVPWFCNETMSFRSGTYAAGHADD